MGLALTNLKVVQPAGSEEESGGQGALI